MFIPDSWLLPILPFYHLQHNPDAFLVGLFKVGVHGQAEYASRKARCAGSSCGRWANTKKIEIKESWWSTSNHEKDKPFYRRGE